MKKALLLLLPSALHSLQQEPWIPACLEFFLTPSYEYNFFNRVDNGSPQLKKTFHTNFIRSSLEFSYPEDWSYEVELEFADTSPISWGYSSFAFQVRKLWLDDVCGDPISLTTGFVYRDASSRMRRALSIPYHGRANFELHASMGKEWSSGPYWWLRSWGLLALGQATSGFPWVRVDLYLEGNREDCHSWRLYAESLFGLGTHTTVDTKDFRGWGRIGHHSINLGLSYQYSFSCFGGLCFAYKHRVYAHSYPEHVNFFELTYTLPFSIF